MTKLAIAEKAQAARMRRLAREAKIWEKPSRKLTFWTVFVVA